MAPQDHLWTLVERPAIRCFRVEKCFVAFNYIVIVKKGRWHWFEDYESLVFECTENPLRQMLSNVQYTELQYFRNYSICMWLWIKEAKFQRKPMIFNGPGKEQKFPLICWMSLLLNYHYMWWTNTLKRLTLF